eukprot:SAG31_NODE_17392_length_672_cov_1.169284_1_plen_179_part_10
MRLVNAMQERDKSGKYLKTIANAKHWSSYDVEHGTDFGGSCAYERGNPQCTTFNYNRGSFNAVVSQQDLVETFWPQFRAAVKGAKLGGTMCRSDAALSLVRILCSIASRHDWRFILCVSSYNSVCTPGLNDGRCVPSCANALFNNGVLRKKFGFDGMIVSGKYVRIPYLTPRSKPSSRV